MGGMLRRYRRALPSERASRGADADGDRLVLPLPCGGALAEPLWASPERADFFAVGLALRFGLEPLRVELDGRVLVVAPFEVPEPCEVPGHSSRVWSLRLGAGHGFGVLVPRTGTLTLWARSELFREWPPGAGYYFGRPEHD